MTKNVFYHGTAAKYKDAILAHGLIPGKGKGGDAWVRNRGASILSLAIASDRPPSVYLTPYIKEATRFASFATQVNGDKAGLIIRITPPKKLPLVKDEQDTDGFRYEGAIPPEWLSVAKVLPGLQVDLVDQLFL